MPLGPRSSRFRLIAHNWMHASSVRVNLYCSSNWSFISTTLRMEFMHLCLIPRCKLIREWLNRVHGLDAFDRILFDRGTSCVGKSFIVLYGSTSEQSLWKLSPALTASRRT